MALSGTYELELRRRPLGLASAPWRAYCLSCFVMCIMGCRGVKIAQDLKKQTGPKLKDFKDALNKEVRHFVGILFCDCVQCRAPPPSATMPTPTQVPAPVQQLGEEVD